MTPTKHRVDLYFTKAFTIPSSPFSEQSHIKKRGAVNPTAGMIPMIVLAIVYVSYTSWTCQRARYMATLCYKVEQAE